MKNGNIYEVAEMNISNGAVRVYVTICGYCYGSKDSCFPSRKRIAEKAHMSARHVTDKLKELEATGVIAVHRELGKHNTYRLTSEEEFTSDPEFTGEVECTTPVNQSAPVESDPGTIVHRGSEPGFQGVVNPSSPESKEFNKEEEKSTPLPLKPKKWNTTPRTLEAREAAIEKTDVEKYRTKWGQRINFEVELEKWKEYARKGKARRPWKDYDDALDTWCSRAFDWGSKPIITQTASFDAKAYNEEILREAEARRDSPRKSISEQRMELQEKEAKKLGLGLREMLKKRASHLGKSIEDYIDQDLKTLTVFKKWEDEGRC